jgi:hypothetical protein
MSLFRKVRTLMVAVAVPSALALASTTIVGTGRWPHSWPRQLDGLRSRATTLDVGWGNQETVYEIPFATRQEFEAAWPHLLSLRSQGAPIIVQPGPSQYYLRTGPTIKAGVLVLWPSAGGPLLPDGTMLRSGPPWPESIKSPSGELPEYVVAENGKWVPYMGQTNVGFYHRARVDIVLIADGEIVDTNRVAFPKDVQVVPGRFRR